MHSGGEETYNAVAGPVLRSLTRMCTAVKSLRSVVLVCTTLHRAYLDPRAVELFDMELVMNVPTTDQRQSIAMYHLHHAFRRVMALVHPDVGGQMLTEDETETFRSGVLCVTSSHGFTGADIALVVKMAEHKLLDDVVPPKTAYTLPGMEPRREAVPRDRIVSALTALFKEQLQEYKPRTIENMVTTDVPRVRWDEVIGLEEAKRALSESIIWSGRHQEQLSAFGFAPTSGVLLYGPPGTGKTLLAKAVASEGGANFISVHVSQVIRCEVGESERMLRGVFAKARRLSPSVVFFDEIEALFGARGSVSSSSQKLISQLLLELDLVHSDTECKVFVLAATNAPHLIDPAFFQSGRLEQVVHVPPPRETDRLKMLQYYTKHMRLAADIDLNDVAASTRGLTGADLECLCTHAAQTAIRRMRQSSRSGRVSMDVGAGGHACALAQEVSDADFRHAVRAAMSGTRAKIRMDQLVSYEMWGSGRIR